MTEHDLIDLHFKSDHYIVFMFSLVNLKKTLLLNMASKTGYEVDPIEAVGRRYECQICLLILRDPVQLSECGHRFCKLCIDNHVKK